MGVLPFDDFIVPCLKRLVKGFHKLFFSPYCGNATFLRHPVCYSCTADEKHRLAQTARPHRVLSVSDLLRNKWFTSFTNRSARPSAFLGYRPLTVFIVPQVERLVNTFFKTFTKSFGLCILRIHDIFSACVVWFTFVYRKQEHLAVGSLGNGLTDSRGSHLFGFAIPSPFVSLLYYIGSGLSRLFSNLFGIFHFAFWRLIPLP